jgi:hypothetical protein
LKELLDAVRPRVPVPTPAGDRLAASYCDLVTRLVRGRYAAMAPADFDELLPYCRMAAATEQADPLTLACFAECLLLHRGPGLEGARLEEVLEAQSAAEKAEEGARADLYVRYVRGLASQAKDDWEAAVAEYDNVFRRKRLPPALDHPPRRRLAARGYFEAGKVEADPAAAFGLFAAANELSPGPVPRAYRVKLLVAGAGANVAGFVDLVQKVDREDAPARWQAAEAAEVSRAFAEWADRSAANRRALAAALPADPKERSAKHAVLLFLRGTAVLTSPERLRSDVARTAAECPALRDAEEAARLAKSRSDRASALGLALAVCLQATDGSMAPANQRAEYRAEAARLTRQLADLLLHDDAYQWSLAGSWADSIAREFDRRGEKDKSKALREAARRNH